jgi:hypothetical protein
MSVMKEAIYFLSLGVVDLEDQNGPIGNDQIGFFK